MLFVTLGKAKPETVQERMARRLQWQYPEGLRVLAEYWPVCGPYSVIIVGEADSSIVLHTAIAAWTGLFEFEVYPVLTGEEGLQLIKQMMPK